MIDLPVEIRNDVARLEIAGERSAGAVQLLDKRWRRRTLGVVSGSAADRSQPLVGASYYLQRALNPFADVRLAEGVAPAEAVGRFLDQKLPMLLLADVGNIGAARERLNKWIEDGGILVRFAGPHLAGESDDLRAGAAAPRRAHARRRAELGQAAKPRGVLAREPVFGNAGAQRCDGDAAGAGGARRRPHPAHLGDARRRHAACHRPAPRQGRGGAVPCHGGHALVGSADLRRVRRDAQAAGCDRRLCRKRRQRRLRHDASPCLRPACSTASAPSRRRRRRRGRSRPTSTAARPSTTRPASTVRRKASSP